MRLAVSIAPDGSLPAGHQLFRTSEQRHQSRRQVARRADGGGSAGGSGSGSSESEMPPELEGLCISEDGQYLIDSKTGKQVNEFGATRFDVAVRGA